MPAAVEICLVVVASNPFVRKSSRAAATFRLERSLPNPAHGHATFRFSLGSAGAADLALYDLSGRRVATVAQ